MKFVGYFLVFLIASAIALIIAGQMGALSGKPPPKLGVTDGKLRPPSKTPNSVSSQAGLYPEHPQKDYASIAPLSYTGDGNAAMEKLANVLQQSDRTAIVTREPGYIYAQSSTALFRFTDDMEFWLDQPNKVIQVRSASRLGRKDFGVNRARMEAIRARFSA